MERQRGGGSLLIIQFGVASRVLKKERGVGGGSTETQRKKQQRRGREKGEEEGRNRRTDAPLVPKLISGKFFSIK